jgi:hypothetical protein
MNKYALLLAATLSVATAFAQQTAPSALPPAPPPHADTQLAQELTRLKQVDALKAKLAEAASTPAENLWKAQLILASWDDAARDKSERARTYLAAVADYLKTTPRPDGAWALAQAQFILTKLSQPVVTRMEYFAINAKDRAALAPLAALADQLLAGATTSLDAAMKIAEAKQPFDEKVYMKAYGASAEAKYYAAWSSYFRAMALEPGVPERQTLLTGAAAALNEWAVDDTDNGVNFQAYLLRGKILGEARDFPKALADFAKAQNEKAPAWVQYQARYQAVVANLKARDFKAAAGSLDLFKRSIPRENTEAILSAEMLGFRVNSAIAESRATDAERKAGRLDALAGLSAIIEKDPRFKDLVYEQLAAQIPENADLSSLLPMQQLALAHFSSQGQRGDTPESRQSLKQSIEAATAVRDNKDASKANRTEATYLIGVCNAVLGNLPEAAKYNVEFAEMAPADPRAKQIVELALQQIGELRKISVPPSADSTGGGGGGAGLSPELRDLAHRALKLSIEQFGQLQWRYPQARMLEDEGEPAKLAQAARIYEQIPQDDKNYLDARYRLVNLATSRFSNLPPTTSEQAMQAAAQEVFKACTAFINLLDHPPASAARESLESAQAYRYDIWIIEAATALHSAVRQPEIALDRLAKLEAARDKLSEPQRGGLLRYRILAYQMSNQPDKAFAVVQEYAKANNQDAMLVIRSMALSTLEEINKVEPTDPAQAKRLATYVVQLFDPIIKQSTADGKADTAFEYRLIQADMMIRAGQADQAGKAALALQQERSGDIRAYMTEARALFASAQASSNNADFAKAQDYFTRILQRLSPGSEAFWECWLRILLSMEGQKADGSQEQIKSKLRDLKGIYGTKFGGDMFRPELTQLALKYGL